MKSCARWMSSKFASMRSWRLVWSVKLRILRIHDWNLRFQSPSLNQANYNHYLLICYCDWLHPHVKLTHDMYRFTLTWVLGKTATSSILHVQSKCNNSKCWIKDVNSLQDCSIDLRVRRCWRISLVLIFQSIVQLNLSCVIVFVKFQIFTLSSVSFSQRAFKFQIMNNMM